MNSRLAQYQTASKIFVNREMLDEDVIGIIVSGSSVHGKPDKNSDVDIHVILRPDCDYRERRNTWINGIEVETFKKHPALSLHTFQLIVIYSAPVIFLH